MKSLEKIAEETFPGGYSCPSKALGTLAVRAKMVKAVRKWLEDSKIMPNNPVPNFSSGGYIAGPQVPASGDNPNRAEYILTDEQLKKLAGDAQKRLNEILNDEISGKA